MSVRSDSLGRLPIRFAVGLGVYALAGAVVSLSGWALNLPRLTDWIDGGVSIQPNAANQPESSIYSHRWTDR